MIVKECIGAVFANNAEVVTELSPSPRVMHRNFVGKRLEMFVITNKLL